MYRHNIRVRRHRRVFTALYICLGVIAVSLLILGGLLLFGGKGKNDTEATAPSAQVAVPVVPKITIKEAWFSFELPSDWKQEAHETRPYNYWIWKSTAKGIDDKTLTLYVDGPPPSFAINQLLPLSRANSGFVLGNISANCNDFTVNVQAGLKAHQTMPSRWENIDFICDVPNFVNQAIGTGSTDGLNKITMTGPTSGKHDYFFIYVDHNIHPESRYFTDAMNSFQVL